MARENHEVYPREKAPSPLTILTKSTRVKYKLGIYLPGEIAMCEEDNVSMRWKSEQCFKSEYARAKQRKLGFNVLLRRSTVTQGIKHT